MSTQWSAEDNVHALGGAACTHQGEVAELQAQVGRLKKALRKIAGFRTGETSTYDNYYCGELLDIADAALAATHATHSPKE